MTLRYTNTTRHADLVRLAEIEAEAALLRARLACTPTRPGYRPLGMVEDALSLSEAGAALLRWSMKLVVEDSAFFIDLPARAKYLNVGPVIDEVEGALNHYFLGAQRTLHVLIEGRRPR